MRELKRDRKLSCIVGSRLNGVAAAANDPVCIRVDKSGIDAGSSDGDQVLPPFGCQNLELYLLLFPQTAQSGEC